MPRRRHLTMSSDRQRGGLVWRALRARLVVECLLSCVVLALAVLPASAQAGGGDVAATRTYLQVNYGLVQVVTSRIGPIEAGATLH
jgi:hypothetical protein